MATKYNVVFYTGFWKQKKKKKKSSGETDTWVKYVVSY